MDDVYRYITESEIDFIKKQLDGRPWIRLPKQVTETQIIPENIDFSTKTYEVSHIQSKVIPVSRIIEIVQTNKIVKEIN